MIDINVISQGYLEPSSRDITAQPLNTFPHIQNTTLRSSFYYYSYVVDSLKVVHPPPTEGRFNRNPSSIYISQNSILISRISFKQFLYLFPSDGLEASNGEDENM